MPYSDPDRRRAYHHEYHLHGKVGRPKPTLEERFWAKVDKSGECWLWMAGRLAGKGYGRIKVGGTTIGAHRVSLEWHLGRPLAPGELACHHCDNPPCVRPDHLFAGTQRDNLADRETKGRTLHVSPTAETRAKRSATMRATIARKREAHSSSSGTGTGAASAAGGVATVVS